MNTMIALVSEQRMQNIIPFFQKDSQFQRLRLIRSSEADDPATSFARAWKDTENSLNARVEVIPVKESVDAYNIARTREVVSQIITGASRDETFTVNFTGGTKCMSVGAYQAAQDNRTLALYVDTANEKLIWFRPDGGISNEAFDLAGRLKISSYFQANAREIDIKETAKGALRQRDIQVARSFIAHWPQPVVVMERFRKALNPPSTVSQKKKTIERKRENPVTQILEEHVFLRPLGNDWQVDPEDEKFITGGWFEAVVCEVIRRSAHFDDVQANIVMAGVQNEMDVVVTRSGQMAFVECKSGGLGGSGTLDKIQAIRSRLGTFARAFLVTTSRSKEIDDKFRARAKIYGIGEIIAFEEVLQAADKIKLRMRGTP